MLLLYNNIYILVILYNNTMKKEQLENMIEIDISKKQLSVNGNSMDLGENFIGARASVQKPQDLALDLKYASKPNFSPEDKQEDIFNFLNTHYSPDIETCSYYPEDFQEEIKKTGSYYAISLTGNFEAYIH